MVKVKYGDPLGSILDVVIFLIFINDMPLFISEAYAEVYAVDSAVNMAL